MEILFKSVDFIALNKHAGMLMYEPSGKKIVRQGEAEAWTVADFVRGAFPETAQVGDSPAERPGMVHRLDKETSGVLLIARSQEAFLHLKSQFAERKVTKEYLALVYGVFRESRIINKPIGIVPYSVRRSTGARNMRMIKPAVTSISSLAVREEVPRVTFLKAEPKTGRTHQIRVHLASIGLPVVGDKVYGQKKQEIALERHFLHAYRLSFLDMSGNEVSVVAPLPESLSNVLRGLGLSVNVN